MALINRLMRATVQFSARNALAGSRVRGLVWVDTYDDVDAASSPEAVSDFLTRLADDFAPTVRAFVEGMFLPGADPDLVAW